MFSRLQSPRGPHAFVRGAVSAAAVAAITLALLWPASTFVEAKTPGKSYCYHGHCHRVMTLDETRRAVGKRMVVRASHYDDPKKDRYNPSNLTASGEWFRAGVPDNAASPKLPNGTVIMAWNPATRQSAVLRINNAGPYWGNRSLDVSRAAAERLGFSRQGIATLHIQIIRAATREDVAYRKGRRYAAVPGPIGAHGSFDLAMAEANRRMGGQPSTPPEPTTVPITVASAKPAAPAALAPTRTATGATAEPAIVAAVTPPPAQVATTAATGSAAAASSETPAVPASSRPNATVASAIPPAKASLAAPIPTATALAPEPVAATASKKSRKATTSVRTAELRSLTSAAAFDAAPAQRRQRGRNSGVKPVLAELDAKPRQASPTAAPRRTTIAGNTYLPTECRNPQRSCEFRVSSNGSVSSVRSWPTSSKRP